MPDERDREAAGDCGAWGWIGGYVTLGALMALRFGRATGRL